MSTLRHTGSIARGLWGGITDGRVGLGRRAATLAGFTASGLRFALGTAIDARALGPRPTQPLILYEFEGCPFCRRVREALSLLDLDAEIRPCPKGGERFRAELVQRGGRAQFPYLIDPDAGVELYESGDIIEHLWSTYGRGRPPAVLRSVALAGLAAAGFALLGVKSGVHARPSRAPAQPLQVWGFEASPFTRFVRQTLCELELPHVMHTVAKDSPSRPAFVERSGRMQVPFLFDPDTGAELFESAAIQAYLEETYAA